MFSKTAVLSDKHAGDTPLFTVASGQDGEMRDMFDVTYRVQVHLCERPGFSEAGHIWRALQVSQTRYEHYQQCSYVAYTIVFSF